MGPTVRSASYISMGVHRNPLRRRGFCRIPGHTPLAVPNLRVVGPAARSSASRRPAGRPIARGSDSGETRPGELPVEPSRFRPVTTMPRKDSCRPARLRRTTRWSRSVELRGAERVIRGDENRCLKIVSHLKYQVPEEYTGDTSWKFLYTGCGTTENEFKWFCTLRSAGHHHLELSLPGRRNPLSRP